MTEEQREDRKRTIVTWSALTSGIALGVTIVGSALFILNWLYTENNRLRSEIVELNARYQSDIAAVRIEFARNQVTRPELKETIRELTHQIDIRLDRIEQHLLEKK